MKTPIILATVLGLAGTAVAQHAGDIYLTVESGRITTNQLEGMTTTPERVFGSEFEDPNNPTTIDEPGFDNAPGTFAPSSTITFNLLAPLRVWTGTDFGNTNHTMDVAQGSNFVTTGNGFVSGFGLPVANNGEWHEHYDFTLTGNPNPTLPNVGIYLLEMELTTNQIGVSKTLPFWIVFNYEDTELNHDAAIDYARENLVPEPASLTTLALGAVVLLRRKARSR